MPNNYPGGVPINEPICDPVLDAGRAEIAKGIIHSLLFAGHLMAFTYSIMANMERPSPHLKRNILGHGLGAVWEFGQVLDHLK